MAGFSLRIFISNTVLVRADRFWRWLSQRLWVRPAFYCIAAVAVVVLAALSDRYIGAINFFSVSQEVIKGLLSIIASSMLAVAIFAVSVMNSSYASAISATTPRAFEIVVADNSTKQALSSFVGAFIFAVVGIVGINFGSFGNSGRVVMFAMTIWVFVWVIGTFVYWIDYVTRLGQMRFTVQRVAMAAEDALASYLTRPVRGAIPVGADHTPPLGAAAVTPEIGGVIEQIDMSAILTMAENEALEFDLAVRTGAIVGPDDVLCHVSGKIPDEDLTSRIRDCFVVGAERDPTQDPEMTIRLLAEIADRALSPGVNDPGTANDVLDALARVFTNAFKTARKADPPSVDPRVRMPVIDEEVLVRAAFEQIGRDGAGVVEVAERLQRTLRAVSQAMPEPFTKATRQHSRWAMRRAETALEHDWEVERVRHVAVWSETAD